MHRQWCAQSLSVRFMIFSEIRAGSLCQIKAFSFSFVKAQND
jgi:hypothetical protein